VAARVDLPIRWAHVGVLGLAMVVGLLAGVNPMLALAAAFGIAFVAIALVNLTAGLCVFAVLTFVDAILPASGALSAPRLMGMLLLVSWIAHLTTDEGGRRRLFEHAGFLYVLALFVVWVLLSITWAEDAAPVLDAAFRYLPNALLFPITYWAIRTRDDALWLIGAFVIGTLISAAYGLVSAPSDPDSLDRLTGAAGNANETAAALGAGAALAAALALALKEPALRLAAAFILPLCVYSMFLTLSRGALVALAAMLVTAVLIAGRRRGAAIAAAALAAIVCVGYFLVLAPPEARDRVFESDGGAGRSDIWRVGWRMVEAEPAIGVGAGNFSVSSVHYLIEPGAIVRDEYIVDTPKVAHNMYLEILAELGVVGMALFLSILGYALYCALAAIRSFTRSGDKQMEYVSRALFVALIGLLVSDFFGSRQFSKQLWLLMSIAPALLAISRVADEDRATLEEELAELDDEELGPYEPSPAAISR
jgi:O-antigen ligase